MLNLMSEGRGRTAGLDFAKPGREERGRTAGLDFAKPGREGRGRTAGLDFTMARERRGGRLFLLNYYTDFTFEETGC